MNNTEVVVDKHMLKPKERYTFYMKAYPRPSKRDEYMSKYDTEPPDSYDDDDDDDDDDVNEIIRGTFNYYTADWKGRPKAGIQISNSSRSLGDDKPFSDYYKEAKISMDLDLVEKVTQTIIGPKADTASLNNSYYGGKKKSIKSRKSRKSKKSRKVKNRHLKCKKV